MNNDQVFEILDQLDAKYGIWPTSIISKKSLLLAKAKRQEARPPQRSSLGGALGRYTSTKYKCYDADFCTKIQKIAPQWFLDTAKAKKTILLKMACDGLPRPTKTTNKLLSGSLGSYTNKRSKNRCYDEDFTTQLKAIRPDWFANTADKNRQAILLMAKKADSKPIANKHPLGKALECYTNPKNNSYNVEFDREIRVLAPHWFLLSVDVNKKQLMEMAKNGQPKPHGRSKLGQVLYKYVYKHANNECFDQDFYSKLKKLRPDWFLSKTELNKNQLLTMAKNKENKPRCGKHSLGSALVQYTWKNGKSYDPSLDRKIRKLAPHWFRK